ncbi:hypothetical protein EG68_01931 [Paragonimus skrjabini miyazakii]|uniref:Uncharacterized protein n=1 Tax=Paragonimus skrjabini miyazakii TaxID=59628 RepID=A0A8S9Z152_9TREM|nr:hypothetical protein EG68_01931 [Paragonimus skrjabini miyazakii]
MAAVGSSAINDWEVASNVEKQSVRFPDGIKHTERKQKMLKTAHCGLLMVMLVSTCMLSTETSALSPRLDRDLFEECMQLCSYGLQTTEDIEQQCVDRCMSRIAKRGKFFMLGRK